MRIPNPFRYISGMLAAVPGGARDVADPRFWNVGPAMSASGEIVTPDTVMSLDIVQAILEALAGTVSSLPLKMFRVIDEDRREVERDHPVADILHRRPSWRVSKQEFFDEWTRHLAFWRNAYAEIAPGNGAAIGELHIIHPARVLRVERDRSGRVFYRIRGLGMGPEYVLRDDQIWHVRKAPLSEDGLCGRPIFETGREVFGRTLAVERYGARWFLNSGQSGGILEHPGYFKTPEERDEFLENWRKQGVGANVHRDRLLLHGIKYQRAFVPNDQAQFIETMKALETKVCGIWQMPPHRVSRLDRATNNNIEHQSLEYVMHTLAPWICAFEQGAERDLLIEDERGKFVIEFNVDGLLRGDIAARYQAYALGRQWGWLSVNDIRRRENMEPVAEGDERLSPMNMTPLGAPREPPGSVPAE